MGRDLNFFRSQKRFRFFATTINEAISMSFSDEMASEWIYAI